MSLKDFPEIEEYEMVKKAVRNRDVLSMFFAGNIAIFFSAYSELNWFVFGLIYLIIAIKTIWAQDKNKMFDEGKDFVKEIRKRIIGYMAIYYGMAVGASIATLMPCMCGFTSKQMEIFLIYQIVMMAIMFFYMIKIYFFKTKIKNLFRGFGILIIINGVISYCIMPGIHGKYNPHDWFD